MTPEVGRQYTLVRPLPDDPGDIACVRYERFSDGSAMAVTNAAYIRFKNLDTSRYTGGTILNADESDTAWHRLWSDLLSDGFLTAAEAQRLGHLPPTWQPPPPTPGLRW